jgi:chemotaxis protein MotB
VSLADRRKRRGYEEEHENHERWLVSYADMITVLMALFIVLFAISQVDQHKFIELRNGLANGFGTSAAVPVSGGTGVLPTDGIVPAPVQLNAGTGPGVAPAERTDADASAQRLRAAKAEVERLLKIRDTLKADLERQKLHDRVRFRITERGLVAAVIADDVFFANASAQIQPTGKRVLDAIAPTLNTLPEHLDVEGHANHLKMTGGAYPTNWELSTARAASVVRHLIDSGRLTPTRLTASGFGDTRPLYAPDHPDALTGNRRVDLVVVSEQPSEVRSLLPLLAADVEG